MIGAVTGCVIGEGDGPDLLVIEIIIAPQYSAQDSQTSEAVEARMAGP
jgi:hypothetical protein